MKKLLVAFQLIAVSAGAQIALEATHPVSTVYDNQFGVVNLSASGYKYMQSDTSQITIYNLNHSVYRTFPIPAQYGIYPGSFVVSFVSEELFDLNPNDIEFMITYIPTSSSERHIRVYNETGSLLFSRDSFGLVTSVGPGVQQSAITYTSSGVKMTIRHEQNGAVEVYSLPGVLPCNECTGGIISGINPTTPEDNTQQHQLPNPYPNPTNSTTTIPYQLPAGINSGQLIIYDLMGQEVKRYSVSSAFTTIEIASGELAAGTYSYSLQTSAGTTQGHQIVVLE